MKKLNKNVKSVKTATLPKFYIHRKWYREGKRDESPLKLKCTVNRTYTEEEREAFYNEAFYGEDITTREMDSLFFRYYYGRPNYNI